MYIIGSYDFTRSLTCIKIIFLNQIKTYKCNVNRNCISNFNIKIKFLMKNL